MKQIFITFCILFSVLTFQIQARQYQGMSIGAKAVYNNYNAFETEGFAQANFLFGRTPFNPKAGLTYRSFTTDYKTLNDLDVSAVGLFLGTDVYPFKKLFFTGVQLEFDLNIFNKNAMNVLRSLKDNVTRSFPGFRSYAVAGLDIPLSKRVNLQLSGMPGWQFYVISDNWEVSSGGTSVNITTQNGTTYSRFIYQFNIGLSIRLRKK
jgi:hypothetical protein